jgi:hypothetical protein
MALLILRAAIHRTGDVGIDLPAGASASSLQPTDYHLMDMEPADHKHTRVIGCDLPAGVSARDLRPEDYQPWESEPTER